MPTITRVISGDTPSGLTLLTLVRSDTNAAQPGVSLPAAFTDAGSGVWTYTFADATPPASYRYTYRRTWSDTSFEDAAGELVGSGTPTCALFTYSEFCRRFGTPNVASASNKGDAADGTVDTQAVQQAFNYAVDALQNALRPGIYVIPLDFTPNGGTVPADVKEWAMVLAMENLYNARGREDANRDPVGDKYTAMAKEAIKAARRVRFGNLGRLPAAVGVSTAITSVDPRSAAARYVRPGGWC